MENIFWSKNLAYLRKQIGITQISICKELGINPTLWSNWEVKNTFPRISYLLRISRYFSIIPDDLLFKHLAYCEVNGTPGEKLINRIVTVLDYYNISIYQNDIAVGYGIGYLNMKLKAGGPVDTGFVSKFLSIHSKVNPEWLLTGKGKMIKNSNYKNPSPKIIARIKIKGTDIITPIYSQNQNNSQQFLAKISA